MQLILEESSAAPVPLHGENTVRCENHQTKKYRSGNTHETVPAVCDTDSVVTYWSNITGGGAHKS